MKKIFVAALLAASLAACGGKSKPTETPAAPTGGATYGGATYGAPAADPAAPAADAADPAAETPANPCAPK